MAITIEEVRAAGIAAQDAGAKAEKIIAETFDIKEANDAKAEYRAVLLNAKTIGNQYCAQEGISQTELVARLG